ncbi:hypothetical protein DMB65_12165 [Flavobacterium cheongpyeongense]|uniref:Uncharacterized protein n=1 Tax=Flavobacterium cheongpyeongense TaxID=2212651 RepID=A0A2V4BNX8_9FLAO|nr:hypothetical protein [Flavobacterium cheongpyeongense]PXY40655.1 hypothetical protein DMB65_12165 [Flavobacterium cheongpyeongense]
MIKEFLSNIFDKLEIINEKENFKVYEVIFTCKDFEYFSINLSQVNYDLINNYLKVYSYKWDLYIEQLSYSASQDSFSLLELEEDADVIDYEIKFTVHKEGAKTLIVNNNTFEVFLNSLTLSNFLLLLSNREYPHYFYDGSSEIVKSNNNVGFNYNNYIILFENNLVISKQCNFRNYSEYLFNPHYFYFKELEENDSLLFKMFSRLSLIYCLIYIYDTSEIKDDLIILKISGNKTFEYSIQFKDIDEKLLPTYFQILEWIYSEQTKIEDKISLARNIITSYLKEGSITIGDSVFSSILSSNQIYIKGNISKYFETKNKIIEQVENTVNKVNQSLDTFFNNFQKSIFVFISFFLTVFIYKIINKAEVDKIFNQETSIIGLGLLMLSLFFMIFSRIILNLDKNRMKSRYEKVKNRYYDVLIKEDIEKILNNDEEYISEIDYLNTRVLWYTALWVTTLILFMVILFLASDYLDVNSILCSSNQNEIYKF